VAALGADCGSLEAACGLLRTAQRRLEAIAAGCDSSVRSMGWHGADADEFRRGWGEVRAALASIGSGLAAAAREIAAHAAEQDEASRAVP
jgi:hypothetical protein